MNLLLFIIFLFSLMTTFQLGIRYKFERVPKQFICLLRWLSILIYRCSFEHIWRRHRQLSNLWKWILSLKNIDVDLSGKNLKFSKLLLNFISLILWLRPLQCPPHRIAVQSFLLVIFWNSCRWSTGLRRCHTHVLCVAVRIMQQLGFSNGQHLLIWWLIALEILCPHINAGQHDATSFIINN